MKSKYRAQWRDVEVRSPFILPGVYVIKNDSNQVVALGQITHSTQHQSEGQNAAAPASIVEQWILNKTAAPIDLVYADDGNYPYLGTVTVYPRQNRLPWPVDDDDARRPDQHPKQVSDNPATAAEFLEGFPGDRGSFSYTITTTTAAAPEGYLSLDPEVQKGGKRRLWMEILRGPTRVIGYAYGEHAVAKVGHQTLRVTQVWQTALDDQQFPLPSLTRFGYPGSAKPTSRNSWFLAALNNLPVVEGETLLMCSSDVSLYSNVPASM